MRAGARFKGIAKVGDRQADRQPSKQRILTDEEKRELEAVYRPPEKKAKTPFYWPSVR